MKQMLKPTKLDIKEWNVGCPSDRVYFLNAFSKISKKKIKRVINFDWNKLPKYIQQAWILANKQAFEEGFPCPAGCFKL